MFGHSPFYHETTRRYVAVFGTLFNDIKIERKDNDGNLVQTIKVPVNYGPMQKFLARVEGDPSLTAPAISLPRMSFEITSMTYDGERKLTGINRNSRKNISNSQVLNTQFSPTPYNIDFELNIMTKYNEDGTKILEQIVPFFKPDFSMSVKMVDELDMYLDVAIVLNSVSTEDVYEGSFEERRALIWTLSFTLKGYFFGPITSKKVIKFAQTNVYGDTTATTPVEYVSTQPGLTANGVPTGDINSTIDYDQIEFDDNWDYVVVTGESNE
jgi:hypothetical protein